MHSHCERDISGHSSSFTPLLPALPFWLFVAYASFSYFTMSLTLIIVLLVAASLLYHRRAKDRIPKGYSPAPGPQGLPLIGNAHQLGPHPHRQVISWARTYGEIYKIRLGWNDWYMLCSPSAVKEIMDRQSKDSSSRAPMPVANDALSGGLRFLFMEYGPEWRKLRAISHKLLTPGVSATFKPSQEWEAKMLLEEVLKGVEEKGSEVGYRAIRRYTVSVIMTSTYGKRIAEWVRDHFLGFLCFIAIWTHGTCRIATKSKRYTAS